MNILIIKHGALGDVVRTSYFAEYISKKYDCCNIYWITSIDSFNILRFNPFINNIYFNFHDLISIKFDIIYSLDDEINYLRQLRELNTKEIIGAYINNDDKILYTDNSSPWFDMGLLSKLGKREADYRKK